MSRSVTIEGSEIYICDFRYVDPRGEIETCRHHAACTICGHCSKLDGSRELGHCPGHLGLMDHIPTPGSTQRAAVRQTERRQEEIRGQDTVRRQAKHQLKSEKKPHATVR